MTDQRTDAEQHPIARHSLYERMSTVARGDRPSPIEAARAHLGVSDLIPEQEPIRGSVEDAMIAGADLDTGELPRDEVRAEDAETDRIIEAQGGLAAAHTEAAPPERQTFNSAPPPPAQPAPKPQEVIEPERAADGAPAPYAASTLGELVNLLEGGQLSADAILAVSALGQGMRELAERTGKRQKGRVAINLNLVTDDTGEAFFVEAEFKVTAPKEPRRKTMLWQDDKGRMTPSQPRQRVFFGVKDVGDAPRQIRQIP